MKMVSANSIRFRRWVFPVRDQGDDEQRENDRGRRIPKRTAVVTVFALEYGKGTRRSCRDGTGYDNQRVQLSADLDEAPGDRRDQGDIR